LACAIVSQHKKQLEIIIMKKRKLIGVIVAASLVAGFNAAFAKQNQPADQNTQSSQDQQSSQTQSDAQIQPPSPPSVNEPAGASTADWNKETFIKEAAQNSMAEVNMAQLGTTKAQDPGLKEAAQRLVTDHSKLNDQLKELASKKGVTLSTDIDSKHQKMIDHVSSLSGSEFDKAFASHMVQGHKKSIAKYKQAAAQNDDTEIRDFAKNTLPTLQEHLTLVQKYAPAGTAGIAVEEPAGAESEQKDDASPAPQYKNKDLDDSSKTPDATAPDSSQKP
jgi:putative membrane protein